MIETRRTLKNLYTLEMPKEGFEPKHKVLQRLSEICSNGSH